MWAQILPPGLGTPYSCSVVAAYAIAEHEVHFSFPSMGQDRTLAQNSVLNVVLG